MTRRENGLYSQCHVELRTLPRTRIDTHPPTVQLHDFLAQRQPQSRTAFLAADLDKGLEYSPLLTIGNPFAVVLDTDNHPLAMATGLQTNQPFPCGMAQRIVRQVVEHPVQLRLISLQPGQRPP